jgi:hypothetical protein
VAKGIEIGINSETKAFKQGVELGVIQPLENAVDALDELGRADGAEQLERALKDAQDETKKLQRETRETADTIEREYRSAYREMKRNADDGFSRSGEAAKNFRDEARQNFAETAASFDGTLEGITDGIQGTLAGAAVGVGGVAGLALGTLGLIGGATLARVTADAEKAEERVQSMYDAFIESGLNYLTQEQALQILAEITGDSGRLKAAEEQAERLGLPIQTVLAAQVQAGEERNEVLRVANDLLAESLKKLEDGTYTEGDRIPALERIVGEYEKLNSEQATALRGAELYRAASELITGQQILTNEEIQKRNQLLAQTPREIPVSLVPDEAALEAALRRTRRLRLNIEGVDRLGRVVI